ncbi:MAG: MFS transporter [Oscillospiraceae bacterium]
MGVFILYGFYTAMVAGAERALITEIAPPDLRGTMLGLQATVAGIALLPASVIAGFLWDNLGPRAPFLFGAALSAIAAVLLMVLLGRKAKPKTA